MDDLFAFLLQLPICKSALLCEYARGVQLLFIANCKIEAEDVQFLNDLSIITRIPVVLVEPTNIDGNYNIRRFCDGC